MRNLNLSRLQSGFKFSYVVQKFKSVYPKSTVVSILLESKVNKPIRTKVWRGRKVGRNMEKRQICSPTIAKRLTTILAMAAKEKVDATTVRRMLNRKAIRTFKKATRFLITKQNGACQNICCGIFRRRFRNAYLKHMMWVDQSYVVPGEYFNHQNKRCYGKRFDLIPDFKRCRLVTKSPTKVLPGSVT